MRRLTLVNIEERQKVELRKRLIDYRLLLDCVAMHIQYDIIILTQYTA